MTVEEMNPVERLHHSFGEIPHSVQLYDLYKVTTEQRKSLLKRLQSELELSEEEQEEEVIRRKNLYTIVLFHLKQPDKALTQNTDILKGNPENVTALVNRIYIKMASGCEREAKCLLADLKSEWNREGQEILRASAFADEAYSLSRISPKFYVRSIELFEKAIEKCPDNYSWKFGCALSCKRCLPFVRGTIIIKSDDRKRFCEMAVSYLYEVAMHGSGSLSALSWAHLGELLCQLKNAAYPLSAQIVSVAITICPFSARECLIKALEWPGSEKDERILERCGHSLQFDGPAKEYKSCLQDCYTLLVMAYKLRPTTYGCDKLASILLKMVEQGITPNLDNNPFLRIHTYHSGKTKRGNVSSHKGIQQTFRRSMPSKSVVKKYPEHPLLIEAVKYATKSLTLTEETNMFAFQFLGNIYRKLDKPDYAIATFRKILSFQKATLYEKVNAYEQIGFCQLDKSENPKLSDSERESQRGSL